MSDFEATLAHFGVKGMKWGVRRRLDQVRTPVENHIEKIRAPVDVSVAPRPGKRIGVKGGNNLPATQDAINAAKAKQKAKQSGTNSLTTPELQALVTRMNLEQQYSRMNPRKISIGEKLAVNLAKDYGPTLAYNIADQKLGNSQNLTVKAGLQVAKALLEAQSNNSGKKKKKK